MPLPTVAELQDKTKKHSQVREQLVQIVENVLGLDVANANPLFKPVKVKVGDNANTFAKPGIYYHWGPAISKNDVANWPFSSTSNNIKLGVLVVTNPQDILSEGLIQTFYSYLDSDPIQYRKIVNGSASSQNFVFSEWISFETSKTKNVMTKITTSGIDILNLPIGDYHWDLALGNSLINAPDCPYKFGRLEIRPGGGGREGIFKLAVFYPYGRDKNFYINTNYEGNIWSGWRTFKDSETLNSEMGLIAASSSAHIVETLTGENYFGKEYSDAQISGNTTYAPVYQVGFNDVTGSGGALFNRIKARISNTEARVEWRVFIGDKCTLTANGYRVSAENALLPDFSGVIEDFPSTRVISEINLGKIVSIPADTPFVIVFKSENLKTFEVGYFNSNTLGMPVRGFNLVATAVDWGAATIAISSASTYIQSGFQLKLALENSGSGTTPEPVQKHKPVVVMPPKLYVMRGLQAHIYPEHLLFERPSLYDHDIVCTKGKQMERGWVWDHNPDVPDPFGAVGLTWNVHDVQTTELLASGTTNVNFVDPNNKNGQNLKVCVIGDSLVSAAAMTARLLAIAETDVTKIKLIGTRGSGLNLHEGRGGWKIDDYTGTGRTYYKFDVSGVTTIPAINSATYKIGDTELLVQEVNISGGAGSIICSLNKGAAPTVGTSGVLNKSNGSAGDSSIAYSNVQTVSGNPFWNATTSSVDFAEYLSRYSLELPDVVFIQLGVNDTFGLTSDQAVIDFCGTAFPKLDTLINSIKSANPAAKIVVMTPPVYANQDAFGSNYGCNQTAWRAKRNIVGFNKLLISNYSNKEANSIYLLGSGVNVDTFNNFPTGVTKINSHNQNNITIQINGVHPDVSGYYQIADAMWACLKAI